MMIHTLAHAMIKELTFSCGYGSAALRERLYCNIENPNLPMNGILIYTASGDSEGTLGGLVREADPGRFERLVEDALRRSQWCSNDPVCMESPGDGAASSNLAACHGCVLLPETSCEEGNRLLDRGLLVGSRSRNRSIRFFLWCAGPPNLTDVFSARPEVRSSPWRHHEPREAERPDVSHPRQRDQTRTRSSRTCWQKPG